ncbi:MerR family transcriptional regulator, partial [Undibacterium luofuense]
MMKNSENPTQIAEAAAFRSSVVAQMAGMPVATLRIWEQRYRAVQPRTSHGGHRLYSALDLQRVMLLRSLTSLGHAISAIAAL